LEILSHPSVLLSMGSECYGLGTSFSCGVGQRWLSRRSQEERGASCKISSSMAIVKRVGFVQGQGGWGLDTGSHRRTVEYRRSTQSPGARRGQVPGSASPSASLPEPPAASPVPPQPPLRGLEPLVVFAHLLSPTTTLSNGLAQIPKKSASVAGRDWSRAQGSVLGSSQ
jgi:hypothetical protein